MTSRPGSDPTAGTTRRVHSLTPRPGATGEMAKSVNARGDAPRGPHGATGPPLRTLQVRILLSPSGCVGRIDVRPRGDAQPPRGVQ